MPLVDFSEAPDESEIPSLHSAWSLKLVEVIDGIRATPSKAMGSVEPSSSLRISRRGRR